MKPVAKPTETATEAAYKAFRKDVGDQLQKFNFTEYKLKARWNATTDAEDADYMLRQKYGLLPPQLTATEQGWAKQPDQEALAERIIAKQEKRLAAR